MTIGSAMTVREVVQEMPQATEIFEKLRIDYCCGADQRLGDACAGAGVDLDFVLSMLQEAGNAENAEAASPDLRHASLTELSLHILDKHHIYTKRELPRLESLLERVILAHGETHPELMRVGRLLRWLSHDLGPHMFKEEQILFPYIVELEKAILQAKPFPFAPFGTVQNPVRMMMGEHETAGEILHELREASSNYTVPADGCVSFHKLYQGIEALERDLHQHIHLENNLLFPRAIEMEAQR
jgi:regulator of cell morphogenesis and NO signaling